MTGNAAAIAEALAGRPVKRLKGGNYLVPCPAHDDWPRAPSLSICDGDRGLMVHCWGGCAARDVYRAIREKGFAVQRDDNATDSKPAKDSSEYRRSQAEKAAWLWSRRRPIAGSIAERYLRETRRYSGILPPTLGFLPPLKPEHHPALIAAFALTDEPEPGILGKSQHVAAIHLTLLKPDSSGKAEVETPKLTIGSPLGKPIVLAPPNDLLGLGITEGIEDGLTVHEAMRFGAWAAGSAPFMPALADTVPDYIEAVTIYGHTDQAGRKGAFALAVALAKRGIEVRIEGLS
jgi:putative DNA primase/helicase